MGDKPDSVLDSHLSGINLTVNLMPPTCHKHKAHGCLELHQAGFAPNTYYYVPACALTARFDPYLIN